MTSNPLIGIGLRYPHYKLVLKEKPNIDWFEVHSENFFQNSGPALRLLQEIGEHYPISLHGVGLSLGSQPLSIRHLERLKSLIAAVNPFLVSEHLSWNNSGHIALPDLFPTPYTAESFDIFCQNIGLTQDFLKREILIENPSSYLEFKDSELTEVDFLVSLCQETGAKILLDINNVFVSSTNHGWDPAKYIASIPKTLVKEIHLAGHSVKKMSENEEVLIDTHDNFVCKEVWDLYKIALERFGPQPTLLEWDASIPALSVLTHEAQKALAYFPLADKQHVKA